MHNATRVLVCGILRAKSRFVRPAGPLDLVVFCRREEPIGRPRTFRRSTTGHMAGRTPSNDELQRLASAAGRAGPASINTIRATFKQAPESMMALPPFDRLSLQRLARAAPTIRQPRSRPAQIDQFKPDGPDRAEQARSMTSSAPTWWLDSDALASEARISNS